MESTAKPPLVVVEAVTEKAGETARMAGFLLLMST